MKAKPVRSDLSHGLTQRTRSDHSVVKTLIRLVVTSVIVTLSMVGVAGQIAVNHLSPEVASQLANHSFGPASFGTFFGTSGTESSRTRSSG